MAEIPNPSYPPTIMASYPHMLAEDTLVWTRWLTRNAHRVTRCWYDVKVGSSIPLPPGATDAEKRLAEGTGAKRIDVVCQAGIEFWAIELKPYGNAVALGQALNYARLYSQQYLAGLPVQPWIICFEMDPDFVDDCARQGVHFEEVGYPPPTP